MELSSNNSSPHVLIFPIPAQGHITPMLHLSELLCLANIQVTFLISAENQRLLTQHTTIHTRFARYPGFGFKTLPEGEFKDHLAQPSLDVLGILKAMVKSMEMDAGPVLREVLIGSKEMGRVTCLVIDGWLSFAYGIASEANVPIITFRCPGASCIWSYICIPQIIQAGELPFKDEEMDQLVKNVPGISSFLRYRDLPSFLRNLDESSCFDVHELLTGELQRTKSSYALIINTFEDLEGSSLSNIRSISPRVYPIGPLHAHLKYRLSKADTNTAVSNSTSSLYEVDQDCMSWLDQKPNKSVVYVSFGSTTILTANQLTELWTGLVQSNKYFLWVLRPNSITGGGPDSSSPPLDTPDELLEGTKKRGYIVKWAPQDEVLAHRAVGGFMTHSGWNSTLESIVAGVPMLCWPYFADQQVNSRLVGEVWKIGLDMKDSCDRRIVEKMINDLMDEEKDELQRSMDEISELAKKSISEEGYSYSSLNLLIEDIKAMAKQGEL